MNRPSPSYVWVESITAHLELTLAECKRLPANERLEAPELNRVLELLAEIKGTFLLQCNLQGFQLVKTK